MLEYSRSRGTYRNLSQADMMGSLSGIDDNIYDGIVSAGVFTNGHVGPEGIDELLRIAKPGAPIVLTVRDSAWEADGFKATVEQLEQDGKTSSWRSPIVLITPRKTSIASWSCLRWFRREQ